MQLLKKISKKKLPFFACSLLLLLFFGQCKKDDPITDSSFRLAFSNDTILFDTVFTSIGTVSQRLMVYNHEKQRVIIQNIRLARGSDSPFRINIDGRSAFEVSDWELGAKDSLFIFVKATIDPNKQDAPLVQTDSIVFEVNGSIQMVKLVAWGQDAYFYTNTHLTQNQTFKKNKPHVIFGWLVVDPNVKLDIEAGTKLYFHNNSGLYVDKNAKISVNGTPQEPALFLHDSRVRANDTIPGQWLGIELSKESGPHEFSNAIIKNAVTGLLIDEVSTAIKLYNCQIQNHSKQGIYAKKSVIHAGNCIVSNCGGGLLLVESGGSYDFRQCDFVNYWGFSTRAVEAISLANYHAENSDTTSYDLQKAYFGNCILDGIHRDELNLEISAKAMFNFRFENCVAKTNSAETFPSDFLNCITNPIKDSIFAVPYTGKKPNFELNAKSPALDFGSMQIINTSIFNLQTDAKNRSRISDFAPDAGALERTGN